jgi:hypothetical protein
MRTTTKITLIAVSFFAAAGLAGCSAASTPSSSPTATRTVTEAPAPSDSASSTTPSSSSSATSTPSTGTGSGSGTGTGTGTGTTACASADLTAAIQPSAGGGAAGSTFVSLVLTNKGASACTLQGWPGVSFVGDGNGTQIGQAATFDRTSPHGTVTLAASGGTATSTLRIVQAGNYSNADCSPTPADGFRIYPPGQKASVFAAKSGLTACASKSVALLTVTGLK